MKNVSEAGAVRHIDAFEFVRLGRSLEGSTPLARFVRLLEGLPEQDPAAVVRWSARADRGPLGEPLIRLDVETVLTLQCQRCLGPLATPIESEVALQLVETEAELDDPDVFDESDMDAIEAGRDFEKVLGSRRFDLLEQVEDELILSVPYVPRHDVCPSGGGKSGDAPDDKPSPFAVLAGLKTRPDDVGK
ncbi:hypothetical protein CDO44_03820 [Pigmentiphaga sp. NML080357]|uniref:YceD family protein n=1 Tax=Pigmentiphaga sp. NML080357 TaxID=2008675 RepID=UPI000B418D6F|nr:DUF177 domain-containing protein [Pigmentiphaga sp. NML080357]OVZ63029.1 hypothetical protein CDO44_03820 [Pigmentiphaga sp. NML080357]